MTTTVKPTVCPFEMGKCMLQGNSGEWPGSKSTAHEEKNQEDCLNTCQDSAATGCTFKKHNTGEADGSCFVHTGQLEGGDGADGYICWVRSKCPKVF